MLDELEDLLGGVEQGQDLLRSFLHQLAVAAALDVQADEFPRLRHETY